MGLDVHDIRQIKHDVISLYKEIKNVWKVAELLNTTGQIIHKVLTENGEIEKMNYFTKEDERFLYANYKKYRDVGQLQILANEMKRTKQFIARKAKLLRLTDTNDKISMKPFAKIISQKAKKRFNKQPHPRGMLGKKHSEETKIKFSERSIRMWNNPNAKLRSEEHRQIKSDNMAKLQASGKLTNQYSRAKSGTITIGGKTNFYRSSWESNIACYLEFLKVNNEISEWQYEPDVFWFEKIKRGVRSYKPDFKITNNDGSEYFIEVKGWMDDKSKTKLNRMRIYFPNVKIELIDSKRYNDIKKSSNLIPNWGCMENGLVESFKKCSIEGCDNKSFSKEVCRKHHYKLYRK